MIGPLRNITEDDYMMLMSLIKYCFGLRPAIYISVLHLLIYTLSILCIRYACYSLNYPLLDAHPITVIQTCAWGIIRHEKSTQKRPPTPSRVRSNRYS